MDMRRAWERLKCKGRFEGIIMSPAASVETWKVEKNIFMVQQGPTPLSFNKIGNTAIGSDMSSEPSRLEDD